MVKFFQQKVSYNLFFRRPLTEWCPKTARHCRQRLVPTSRWSRRSSDVLRQLWMASRSAPTSSLRSDIKLARIKLSHFNALFNERGGGMFTLIFNKTISIYFKAAHIMKLSSVWEVGEWEVDIKWQNLLLYCNSNPIQHKNQNQLRDLQKNLVLHFTSS